jgi:hypothetical protein
MSHTKRPVRDLVTVLGLALTLPIVLQLAASEGKAKPKPIFIVMYVDQDSPRNWIALSKHQDYTKAVEAKNRLAKIKGVIGVGIVPVDPKTGKQAPWPSGVKRPDQPGGKLPSLPKELPAREDIIVRVYKANVEQPGEKVEAGVDYDLAKKHYDRINKKPGWKATWDGRGWPRPDIAVPESQWVDIGPYTTIVVVSIISIGEMGDYYNVTVNGKPDGVTLECIPGTDVPPGRQRVPEGGTLLWGGP